MMPIDSSIETIQLNKLKPKEKHVMAKFISNAFEGLKRPMGERLGREFSKAKNITEEQKQANQATKEKLVKEGTGKEFNFEIGDQHTLNGFEFYPPKPSDKWIVVFNGMGSRYETHLEALDALSKDVGANVLAFNYRGVGDSSGKPAALKDWVEDGQYMLEYLKQKKIPPENIALYGHSLGGGVASDVYKKQDKKSALIMESSPSALSKAVQSKKGILAGLATKLFNWDFNSYRVIKNADASQNIALIVNRRDPTVRYQEASLYKKLAKKEEGKFQRIKIGEKQEEFEKVSVKTGEKDFKKPKSRKEKTEISDAAKEYRTQYGKLRKEGTLKDLPHPHKRVMDRSRDAKPKVEGAAGENLRKFESKFKQEDTQAYAEIVKVFKGFLNIDKEKVKEEAKLSSSAYEQPKVKDSALESTDKKSAVEKEKKLKIVEELNLFFKERNYKELEQLLEVSKNFSRDDFNYDYLLTLTVANLGLDLKNAYPPLTDDQKIAASKLYEKLKKELEITY